MFLSSGFKPCSHKESCLCIVCVSVIGRGGSRQCKSFPACHLAPAAVMLWHIGKWGGRVDKDFNRILKWVMVAFMCVIVTYPKVTAPKHHHPSPARPPHASFCLTDSLKLCLFVCSQNHFHLWSSQAGATCGTVTDKDRRKSIGNLLSKIVYICQIAYYEDNFFLTKRWSLVFSLERAGFNLIIHHF